MFGRLYGFDIVTDASMVNKEWIFPADRFVEWGPEDESYCRFAGYGFEKVTPKMEAYRVGNRLIMHPAFLAMFERTNEVRTNLW